MQVEEVGAFLRALGLADGEDAAQGEDVPFITIRSGPAATPAQSLQPFPRACWRLLLCLSLRANTTARISSSCGLSLCRYRLTICVCF